MVELKDTAAMLAATSDAETERGGGERWKVESPETRLLAAGERVFSNFFLARSGGLVY